MALQQNVLALFSHAVIASIARKNALSAAGAPMSNAGSTKMCQRWYGVRELTMGGSLMRWL